MGKLGQAQAWRNEFRGGGGGDQALRALTEKGPKRQRAHKVYAKIANCLKNSTMSVKIGSILEISAAPQSLPRDKIYGPGGGGAVPPVPADSQSLAKPPGPPVQLAYTTLRQAQRFASSVSRV